PTQGVVVLLEVDLEAGLHVIAQALVDPGLGHEQADLEGTLGRGVVVPSSEGATAAGTQRQGAGSRQGDQQWATANGHRGTFLRRATHPCAALTSGDLMQVLCCSCKNLYNMLLMVRWSVRNFHVW